MFVRNSYCCVVWGVSVASGSRFMIPYLVMRIRRTHIIEDTLNHFVVHTGGTITHSLTHYSVLLKN